MLMRHTIFYGVVGNTACRLGPTHRAGQGEVEARGQGEADPGGGHGVFLLYSSSWDDHPSWWRTLVEMPQLKLGRTTGKKRIQKERHRKNKKCNI